MQDARVRAALLIVCLACLLGSGFVLVAGHHSAPPLVITPPPKTTDETPSPAAHTAPKAAARIYVDVAGAVRRPSLYVLSPESRVMQAILAAGGPTSEADMDAVNLAQKVTDGEKIFVPKRMASAPPLQEISSILSVTDNTPAPASSKATAKHAKGTRAGRRDKITPDSGEQVALNTATEEQLERLPGVGPGMAGRILAYRQQAGGFGKIEDLMQVTGIGPKKYAKIAPCVKLN